MHLDDQKRQKKLLIMGNISLILLLKRLIDLLNRLNSLDRRIPVIKFGDPTVVSPAQKKKASKGYLSRQSLLFCAMICCTISQM